MAKDYLVGFRRVFRLLPEDRADWLTIVANDIARSFRQKYMKGEAEHQSDIGEVSTDTLLLEIENEALDQLAYIMEIKRRMVKTEGLVTINFAHVVCMVDILDSAIDKRAVSQTPEVMALREQLQNIINERVMTNARG